jgi:hypothetical protein
MDPINLNLKYEYKIAKCFYVCQLVFFLKKEKLLQTCFCAYYLSFVCGLLLLVLDAVLLLVSCYFENLKFDKVMMLGPSGKTYKLDPLTKYVFFK